MEKIPQSRIETKDSREKVVGSYIDSKLKEIEKEASSLKWWGHAQEIIAIPQGVFSGLGMRLLIEGADAYLNLGLSTDLKNMITLGSMPVFAGFSFSAGQDMVKDSYKTALQKKKDLLKEVENL